MTDLAFTARTATIVSARVQPAKTAGIGDVIVGSLTTQTAKGVKRVGFSARASEVPSLAEMVGNTVEVSSRYVKAGFMLIGGVSAVAA